MTVVTTKEIKKEERSVLKDSFCIAKLRLPILCLQKTVNAFYIMLIQHVRILKPFLKEYKHRLTLLFLPHNTLNLNVVERI